MEELIAYKPTLAEELLSQIKKFSRASGIILSPIFAARDEAEKNSESAAEKSQWIKPFAIQTDEQAFYLKIDSPDDIASLNKDLEQTLSDLQDSLKKFLENNRELEENLRSKINTFATKHLVQAKKAVKFRLKKLKDEAANNCNTVDELRTLAGKHYADFVKQELLERIVYPLYDGLQQNPNEDAYLWVLDKVNRFLANLGVMTVNISVGEHWDENNPFYSPAPEESASDEYATTNADEKDLIRDILRYAYIFQEDKGADNRQIAEGTIIVMVYRPEAG